MTDQPVDYSAKWKVMAAVGSGVLLSTIDSSIVNIALPTIRQDLDAGLIQVQWVSVGYILALAALLLPFGRWGDLSGKKRIYLTGFVAFTAASALCGLAPTIEALIGLRVLQAVAAAMVTAVGAAIVTGAFPASERGKALGWIGTFVSVGIVTGPVLGGLLISALDWRWIFFVNIPVGIAGSLLVHRFVPDDPGRRGVFDVPGAATFAIALGALALGVTGVDHLPPAVVAVCLAASAVSLAVFVSIERRSEHPMVRLELFRNPLLSVSVITGLLVFVSFAGVAFVFPFLLEVSLGYDTSQTGLFLAIAPACLGLTAPFAGTLSDRIGIRPLTIVGLGFQLVSLLAIQTLTTSSSGWHVAAIAVPLGIGMGTFQAPNNSAIMSSAPPEYAGIASAVLSLTRLTGQLVGLSAIGSLWTTGVARLTERGLGEGEAILGAARLSFAWSAGIATFSILLSVWLVVSRRGAARRTAG